MMIKEINEGKLPLNIVDNRITIDIMVGLIFMSDDHLIVRTLKVKKEMNLTTNKITNSQTYE